jgi:oxalate decarboxylase/phosphoglucose isomerase-like protein (cupin superfamily)
MNLEQERRCTKLKLKKPDAITHGTELIHFKVKPGTLIFFPGYMEHEYAVDHGKEPFRFIHFNIQAVPKEMAKVNV